VVHGIETSSSAVVGQIAQGHIRLNFEMTDGGRLPRDV
jgi:hypothetical protein